MLNPSIGNANFKTKYCQVQNQHRNTNIQQITYAHVQIHIQKKDRDAPKNYVIKYFMKFAGRIQKHITYVTGEAFL